MATFTKHVGRNRHGQRLVVVFREIPDDETNCLVVHTDSLREMYHDQLIREVNSREAQDTVDLYKVLERRHFGDGQQMLNALHNQGLLQKYPVSEIEMQPMPNRVVNLAIVNEQIKTGKIVSESGKAPDVAATKTDPTGAGVSVDTEANLVKPVAVAPVVVGNEADTEALAEGKLLQARLMEEDAKKMREEAYALNPSLKKGGRPKKETV